MTTASASHGASAALPIRLTAGVLGGLAGGVVFGILMQMIGMIPMVAMLVGSESVAVGWLVHLAISAVFGLGYGLLFAQWAGSLGAAAGLGLAYGVVLWVVGALLIMPAWLGMPVFNLNAMAWQSLLGHLLYGLILGLTYVAVRPLLRRS